MAHDSWISVRAPSELKEDLRSLAESVGVNMTTLVVAVLSEWVDKMTNDNKQKPDEDEDNGD